MQPIDHIKASFIHPDIILNQALAFSLEWGENFGKAIHERMKKAFPHLWDQDIDLYDKLARDIKYDSFRWFGEEADGKLTESDVLQKIRQMFPGISQENLAMLSTQGMYYARR